MKLSLARSRVTSVWFAGGGVFYLILIVQTLANKYGDGTDKAWAWAIPALMPTLLLMMGVHAVEVFNPKGEDREVVPFLFWLALGTSCFYVLAVLLTVVLPPFVEEDPVVLMERSNLYLGAMHSLAAGAFGVFYGLKKK